MKKTLYVLVGVAGVGKSTFSKNFKNVISSDNIRKVFFGSEENQDNNKEVFEIVWDLLDTFVKTSELKDVVLDATNLSRKKRIHLYNMLKNTARKNGNELNIKTVVFLKPLKKIQEQNANRKRVVPKEAIEKMYHILTIPKIGVDCDEVEVFSNPLKDFEHEFNYDVPHDSSYHKESVKEHIQMVINNIEKDYQDGVLKEKDFNILKNIAIFHDLGKNITKKKEATYASFKNHEKVSSMYVMTSDIDNKELVAEVILHHMVAHQGLNEKYIKKHKITEEELYYIKKFSYYDNISRIV